MPIIAAETPKVPNESQGSTIWGRGAKCCWSFWWDLLCTDENLPFNVFFLSFNVLLLQERCQSAKK